MIVVDIFFGICLAGSFFRDLLNASLTFLHLSMITSSENTNLHFKRTTRNSGFNKLLTNSNQQTTNDGLILFADTWLLEILSPIYIIHTESVYQLYVILYKKYALTFGRY